MHDYKFLKLNTPSCRQGFQEITHGNEYLFWVGGIYEENVDAKRSETTIYRDARVQTNFKAIYMVMHCQLGSQGYQEFKITI